MIKLKKYIFKKMEKIIKITWDEIYAKVDTLVDSLKQKDKKIFGLSLDGKILAGISGLAVDSIEDADILIDAVYEKEKQHNFYREKYPDKEIVYFFNKSMDKFVGWVEMPWGNVKQCKC